MAKLKKQDMGEKSQDEPKRARKVSKGSSESNRAEDGERVRVKTFKGYDLSDLPEAALPFRDGVYKGNHSYTVTVGNAVPCLGKGHFNFPRKQTPRSGTFQSKKPMEETVVLGLRGVHFFWVSGIACAKVSRLSKMSLIRDKEFLLEKLLIQISWIAQAFEILCKHGAYVIKRCANSSERPASAQVTWSRFGGASNAWIEACQRAGVMSSEDS